MNITNLRSQTINFKELVENSENSMSIDFKSKLIEHFNDEEQRWFIVNFYVYLNYHSTNDYPINLENVYEIIGFANKGYAKRTLENNFIMDEDYKSVIPPRENNLKKQLLPKE